MLRRIPNGTRSWRGALGFRCKKSEKAKIGSCCIWRARSTWLSQQQDTGRGLRADAPRDREALVPLLRDFLNPFSLNERNMGFADRITTPREPLYIYPRCILSLEEDGLMRCGRMDVYVQTQGGHIIGMTTTTVFPNPKVGTPCYAAQWVTPQRTDATSDKDIVRPQGIIGQVIDSKGPTVIIRITEEFAANERFLKDGKWTGVADRASLSPQSNVLTLTNMSSHVAGSHCWIERGGNTELPFRKWAEGILPLPQAALDRYPLKDVERMQTLAMVGGLKEYATAPVEEVKRLRLSIRYKVPCCERPGCPHPSVPQGEDFILCNCCWITFYCSRACKDLHVDLHSLWASALPHSDVPEHNPMGPIIVSFDKDGNQEGTCFYNSAGNIVLRRS